MSVVTVATLAQRDPIFRRIWRAVPRSVDAVLREDIISEIYLEIREGKLHPREIDAQAKRFISAGFATWANPWGDLSLNASCRSERNDQDFTETLADENALAAFDRVTFQGEDTS